MICNYDPFEYGKAIYEVKRTIADTNKIADNGVREIYVNLKAEVEQGKLKELFKIFTDYDYVNEEILPRLTEKKKEINGKEQGGSNMSGISKEIFLDGKEVGIKEGMEQGILKAYIDIYKKGLITVKDAAQMLGMSEEKFMQYVNA